MRDREYKQGQKKKQNNLVLQNHKNLEATKNIKEEKIIYLPIKSFAIIVKYME